MCAPLWDQGRKAVGVLQVDTRDHRHHFKQDDLNFLVAVAGTISMAVENARLHAIEVDFRQNGKLPERHSPLSEDQEKCLDGAISALAQARQILPAQLSVFAELVKDKDWSPVTLENVGRLGDTPTALVSSEAGRSDQARFVNINTATEQELKTLPGVGAAIARQIIGGRPYRDVDGLLDIKGIRTKNLEAMRPLIKVE
jgi:competence protein ComEA